MVLLTIVIPQMQSLDKVIDDPVVRVVQVLPSRSHARCVQRLVPWLRSAVAVHQQGSTSVSRCRGSSDHRDSPVLLLQGDRRPCCAGGASSTGAIVEETVVLPRLQVSRNSLRAAHRLRDELKW